MPRLLAFLLVAACGSVPSTPLPDGPVDDAPGDAQPDAPEPAPSIAEVLDCGTPATAGNLREGTHLQRVDIDLAAFPDARCNDGTAAVFYVRPAPTTIGSTRWVIQLQGGGGCNNPDDCARRWCHVDTNYGMTQMSSVLAPATAIPADGILLGEAPNPLANANHVYVRYCSSDGWAGSSGPLDVDAVHPISGDAIRYRIDFRGRDIIDAVLATLRQDGASVAGIPDLDDATEVLFAGASAGGAGVIQNADHVEATLRAHNPDVEIVTLIDSIFGPRNDTLDWSTSVPCTSAGACTYEAVLASIRAMFPVAGDASCVAWHATNAPATAHLCSDAGHVIRNHVTTPMLVRMGLTDQNISGNYVELGVTVPGAGVMTPARFAQLVHDQLVDLAQLQTLAEEGPSIAREPATFGPPCSDHETLSTNPSVFDVTVRGATMLGIFMTWIDGGTPIHAVWNQGDPIDCAN